MKKRFLSMFLALVLCIGLAVPAFAADSGFTIEDFDGEIWLTEYNGPGGAVAIPSGVNIIGWYVFSGREDLTSVSIPDSMTGIGPEAFEGCTGLTDVYYGGSEAQWRQIEILNIMNANTCLTNATVHCNSILPATPAEPTTPTFIDVPAWCADAVNWAVANGVTEGTGNGNFSPDKVCNRGTIVTFLHRAYVPTVRLK